MHSRLHAVHACLQPAYCLEVIRADGILCVSPGGSGILLAAHPQIAYAKQTSGGLRRCCWWCWLQVYGYDRLCATDNLLSANSVWVESCFDGVGCRC
jgi:hypothetical protein